MKNYFKSIMYFFINLWQRFQKYLYLRNHGLKTVDVKKATQEDLEKLGRKVKTCMSVLGGVKTVQTHMQAIRHKKTGRVVMYPGTIDQIKSMFGKDYEIVESAIKEETNAEIDLSKDELIADEYFALKYQSAKKD
jgi:hypothetical protein